MDIYAEVASRIMAELENGQIPWEKPWTGTRAGAISHTTGKPYSLMNQMLLGKPGEYLTFHQAHAEGGHVKKGAKAKMIVFWKSFQRVKTEDGHVVIGDDGKPVMDTIPMLKFYNVFHVDDCEGIKAKYDVAVENSDIKPIEKAETALAGYISKSGIKLINEKGDRAFYRPSADEIHLPLFEQFKSAEGYYDTAFHESVHSTGHPTRLNRFTGDAANAAFGSESYSKEELVAEIGSCAIMHELGLETKSTFRNNAAYIQGWLKALKNDKRMIVSAAARADKAVNLILGLNAPEQAEA